MLNKIPQHVNVRNKERTRRRDAVFDDNFTAFKKRKGKNKVSLIIDLKNSDSFSNDENKQT